MSDSATAAAANAQLVELRYEPETLTVPAPMVSVPENTAVTAPVGVGQPRTATPAGNVSAGNAASVAFGVVGNWQTTTCALVRLIELVSDNVEAATAADQLVELR